ncbi:conserved hypothetical protein [Methanocaldococcus sp. FS406-22]|uniref:hypothetical protein n=1 Tax=Methanocaldococcus sp. (strain FS406-22) TaxID=644281 RepID=UPI0001BF2F68|nr:hypothetical protein [Methanocaldococcus sp. FS406-22]ADC70500.1 conserved hypothetical protein [Methanocaldococcus sp. FS406-22]
MDIELLLCSMFLLFLFGSEGVLYYYSHKKYKKAKKEWHYITSTKIGIGRNRMAFEFFRIMALLAFSIYVLINIHHISLNIIILLLAFLVIVNIYDKINPASGDIEIYKDGVIILKSFLNYHLALPWKFFKGYKVKFKNKTKYVILVPKSKLFFNIYLKDMDGKVEETIKNHLNPLQ